MGTCNVIARLLRELPETKHAPEDLIEKGGSLTVFTYSLAIRTAILKVRRLNITARCKAMRRSAMPMRSLSSSVLKWPDSQTVDQAVRRWAQRVTQQRRDVVCIG